MQGYARALVRNRAMRRGGASYLAHTPEFGRVTRCLADVFADMVLNLLTFSPGLRPTKRDHNPGKKPETAAGSKSLEFIVLEVL